MTFRNEVQHKQMCSRAWAVRSLVSCMMGQALVICMPQFPVETKQKFILSIINNGLPEKNDHLEA